MTAHLPRRYPCVLALVCLTLSSAALSGANPQKSQEGLERGRRLAELLAQHHYFDGQSAIHELRDFANHSHHPEWTTAARDLCDGWWSWCQHYEIAENWDRSDEILSSNLILSMINVSAQLNGNKSVARFIDTFGERLHDPLFSQLPLLLITHGRFEEARDLIENHSFRYNQGPLSSREGYQLISDTNHLERQVTRFLATIDDPQLASFASAFLPCTPNTYVISEQRQIPAKKFKSTLLKTAAEQFIPIAWTDKALRLRTLEYLAQEIGNLRLLTYDLKQLPIRELTGAAMIQADSESLPLHLTPLILSALASISKGELEVFDSIVDTILSSPRASSQSHAFAAITTSTESYLRQFGPVMSNDTFYHFEPAFRNFIERTIDQKDRIPDYSIFVCAWLASACRSGRMIEVESWIHSLPSSQQFAVQNALQNHWKTMIADLARFIRKDQAPNAAASLERAQFTSSLLSSEIVLRGLHYRNPNEDTLFHQFIENKIILREDILSHGKDLHQIWPRDGMTALEFAIVAKEMNDPVQCLHWGAKAIEEMRPSAQRNVAGYTNAIMAHAENQLEFGNADDARKTLKQLPNSRSIRNNSHFQQRLRSLRTNLSSHENL